MSTSNGEQLLPRLRFLSESIRTGLWEAGFDTDPVTFAEHGAMIVDGDFAEFYVKSFDWGGPNLELTVRLRAAS